MAEFARPLAACCTLLFVSLGAHAERKTTFFHTDGLGSVIAASDEAGALLWRKDYAPYGQQLDSTAENEKLAYTGKEHDDVTGLTYFGARYYDPHLGRFMSVDPIGFVESNPISFNRYAYANNNPYTYVDPDGRWSAKAHDVLLATALAKRVSATDVAAIQAASRDFDRRTQGDDQSHMHSMARVGQRAQAAKTMRDDFIGATMVAARRAADAGNRAAALTLFGEAMHPAMDSSSPEHTDANGNPRVWRGLRDAPGHSPTDWIGNETSKDLTREILASQSRRINSSYDWVFREGKHKEK
jgi:RHS repeat-associated protein